MVYEITLWPDDLVIRKIRERVLWDQEFMYIRKSKDLTV
jgi:hypothetical protein